MSYKTYNFLVNKYTSEKTENLVFEIKDLGTANETLKAYLVEYDLTGAAITEDKIKLYEIDEENKMHLVTTCISYTITMSYTCSCDGKHTSPSDPDCTCVAQGGTAAHTSTQNVLTCTTEEVWGPDGPPPPEAGGGSNGFQHVYLGTVTMSPADRKKKDFWMWLRDNEPECDNPLTQEQKDDINEYIESTVMLEDPDSVACGFPEDNQELFEEIKDEIEDSCNPNINMELSIDSPAFIDDSSIDKTTSEGQKFHCIAGLLKKSCTFRDLIEETFGGEQDKLNVKFVISDTLSSWGRAQLTDIQTVNGETKYTNTIWLKKAMLENNNYSNVFVLKVILHEYIHAYLNIKAYDATLGAQLPTINNSDLGDLIQHIYLDWNSHVVADGSPQSQHAFMYDNLVGIFTQVFNELYSDLITPQVFNYFDGMTFTHQPTGTVEVWNWDRFFKFLTLSALEQCPPFIQNTQANAAEYYFYQLYNFNSSVMPKTCN